MELSKILAFLCSAASYTSNAIAPCAIAALLGRFLPRLGPLVHSSGPFFSLQATLNPDDSLAYQNLVLRMFSTHSGSPSPCPWDRTVSARLWLVAGEINEIGAGRSKTLPRWTMYRVVRGPRLIAPFFVLRTFFIRVYGKSTIRAVQPFTDQEMDVPLPCLRVKRPRAVRPEGVASAARSVPDWPSLKRRSLGFLAIVGRDLC